MYQALRKRIHRTEDDGFTLIELLIVIVILGILAAIVIFAVGSARDDSVKNACKADVKTINTAIEAQKAKLGSTATTTTELKTNAFIKDIPPTAEYTIAIVSGSATGDLKGGTVKTDCSD